MYIKLFFGIGIKSYLTNAITTLIIKPHSVQKKLLLFFGWEKFNFCSKLQLNPFMEGLYHKKRLTSKDGKVGKFLLTALKGDVSETRSIR
jgi:hypothetical protein